MAVSNVGLSLSHLLGGYLYEQAAGWVDRSTAFQVLVGIGGLTTTGCWLFVPWLRSHDVDGPLETSNSD
jgi:hypothetical protein